MDLRQRVSCFPQVVWAGGVGALMKATPGAGGKSGLGRGRAPPLPPLRSLDLTLGEFLQKLRLAPMLSTSCSTRPLHLPGGLRVPQLAVWPGESGLASLSLRLNTGLGFTHPIFLQFLPPPRGGSL